MFRKVRNDSFLLQSAPYPTGDYRLDLRIVNKDEVIDAGETRRCSGIGCGLDYRTVFQHSAHRSLKIFIFKGGRMDNLHLRVPEEWLKLLLAY